MRDRDRQCLEDIVEFAERAARITGDRDSARFVADEAVLFAVRYCLQSVGESAARLSPDARALAAAVPWPQIVAMRHRLVHGYAAVTDAIVYDTVKEDLPVLIEAVRQLLAAEPK